MYLDDIKPGSDYLIHHAPTPFRPDEVDPGAHYRYEFKGVKIDPARIAKVYKIEDGMVFTILKKTLRMGRAHKDKRQDLLDIINAAQRELEMMAEDDEDE